MELKRITFLVDEDILERINLLKKKNVHFNMTEVIRAAINVYYDKSFKYGQDPQSEFSTGDTEDKFIKKAEMKAKAKVVVKEKETSLKQAPKINICLNLLGGEIETNENNDKFCRFNQYTMKETAEQVIPIMQVNEELAENSLFIPSKKLAQMSLRNLRN